MSWRYDHRELLPPNLVQLNGKTYIVPGWRRVARDTRLSNIRHVKPEINVVPTPPQSKYKTIYYPESGKYWCDCWGYIRAKGNCKHVKALKLKNKSYV
jgi:hypothetical protein